MQKSEDIKEIHKALAEVLLEIVNPPKGAKNPFYKSSYADLPSVLNIARTILPKYGLSFSQLIDVVDGKNYLITWLFHESGQWLKSTAPIITKDDNDPQKVGSAITYMRRYSLQAMLGIVGDDDDDDGNKATRSSKQENKSPEFLNKDQVDAIEEMLKKFPEKREGILKWADASSIDKITKDKFRTVLHTLERYEEEIDAKGK
jgi:hypothetical protein